MQDKKPFKDQDKVKDENEEEDNNNNQEENDSDNGRDREALDQFEAITGIQNIIQPTIKIIITYNLLIFLNIKY